VVDGARTRWYPLLLLDAIIFILHNNFFRFATRRAFNQLEILYNCILEEIQATDPAFYDRLRKLDFQETLSWPVDDSSSQPTIYEDMSPYEQEMILTKEERKNLGISFNCYKKFEGFELVDVEFPWNSIDALKGHVIEDPPSKSKQKFLAIIDYLSRHHSLQCSSYSFSDLLSAVVCKVLAYFGSNRNELLPIMMSESNNNHSGTASSSSHGGHNNSSFHHSLQQQQHRLSSSPLLDDDVPGLSIPPSTIDVMRVGMGMGIAGGGNHKESGNGGRFMDDPFKVSPTSVTVIARSQLKRKNKGTSPHHGLPHGGHMGHPSLSSHHHPHTKREQNNKRTPDFRRERAEIVYSTYPDLLPTTSSYLSSHHHPHHHPVHHHMQGTISIPSSLLGEHRHNYPAIYASSGSMPSSSFPMIPASHPSSLPQAVVPASLNAERQSSYLTVQSEDYFNPFLFEEQEMARAELDEDQYLPVNTSVPPNSHNNSVPPSRRGSCDITSSNVSTSSSSSVNGCGDHSRVSSRHNSIVEDDAGIFLCYFVSSS
jgi:hypothetical protein